MEPAKKNKERGLGIVNKKRKAEGEKKA